MLELVFHLIVTRNMYAVSRLLPLGLLVGNAQGQCHCCGVTLILMPSRPLF